jgi:HlyD family secretion protein
MKKRKRIALRLFIAALLIAGSAYGVWRARHSETRQDIPTAQARSGEFAVLVHCRGSLVAGKSVQLVAPLDIQDLQIVWLSPTGSEVKAGQVVIRFDRSKSEQELREKTAALDQAQASLEQAVAQARITADQDKLDLASSQFDRDKARLEASKQAIVSVMEGEKSKIDLGLAEQKVKLQQATIGLHQKADDAKIASQTRLRDEAKAEFQRAQRRLQELELKSPIDGVINYLTNHTQGWMNSQPFKVGDHVFAGLAIAEVPDLATLQMESKLEEVDRGRIVLNDEVIVHVDAFPEKSFPGKLAAVSPLTEQDFTEWPPTRTFRAFAVMKERDARLRPGMNGAADIVETKLASAIRIPAKSLFTERGKPVVYVKTGTEYRPQRVEVRARNTDEVAVTGISAGTTVALTNPELPQND